MKLEILIKQIPDWHVKRDGTWITRSYTFKNFKEVLAFVNAVGFLAEAEGHHPDIHLTDYKKVTIGVIVSGTFSSLRVVIANSFSKSIFKFFITRTIID